MAGASHCAFTQIHRTYNVKEKPSVKYGFGGVKMYQCRLIDYK